MRSFQHPSTLDPVPGEIVSTLRRIDRGAGAEARYLDQLPQLLVALRHQARIESVTASSAIEGVVVDEARAPDILAGRTARFRDRSEAEFAGYTAALDYLYTEDPGELSVGLVTHLHRLLFSRTDAGGGSFKTDDNLVVDRDRDGTRRIRFTPVSAHETPFFVEELTTRANAAFADGRHHPVLVTAACVLDLTCIHPFDDGNGRIARLLTTYLLERYGYRVGRYISIEQLFYEAKDGYYDALAGSTEGWFDDGSHSVWPWATFLIGRTARAYNRFEAGVSAATTQGSKQARVRSFVLNHGPSSFTIGDIRKAVPGVSDQTIRLALNALRDEGRVRAGSTGRGATWRRIAD